MCLVLRTSIALVDYVSDLFVSKHVQCVSHDTFVGLMWKAAQTDMTYVYWAQQGVKKATPNVTYGTQPAQLSA